MKRTWKQMNDAFSDYAESGGIFAALQSLSVPWRDLNISDALDMLYHGGKSADKLISPLVERVLGSSSDPLTAADKTTLARIIYTVNNQRWSKEYATLSLEYNPIENYSMTEEMQDDNTTITYGKTLESTVESERTNNNTDTLTRNTQDARTANLTDTLTEDTEQTRTPNLQRQNESAVYGFNSSDAVPSGEVSDTTTGTETTTNEGTETTTHTGTDNTAHTGTEATAHTGTISDDQTITEEQGGSDLHEHSYTLTRSGNIGVTTSQQMLQSERELWLWSFFDHVVFPDVDKILTLPIY